MLNDDEIKGEIFVEPPRTSVNTSQVLKDENSSG